MHIANSQKNNYLRAMIERGTRHFGKEEQLRILDRLIWATEFEVGFFFFLIFFFFVNKSYVKFLDIKYPAQKRFGVIGAESMVPLVKEVIDEGARLGITDFVIGMPHRGRLLTLCSVMRKPLERILYEFRGLALPWDQIEDSGDVKYHLGYSTDRFTPDEIKVHLSLVPNPSHLEAVNPICMGKTRAKQFYKKDSDRTKTCCILLHGDAAFAGQGSVYESMALTELPDYSTGGVIHLIVNNQIGFTTDSYAARSSPYCTDVARSIASPIFHVNGDDAEAVVRCAKMAVRYRQTFKTDAVVDMLCFRRYGHNEGDEPAFTQPFMYRTIQEKLISDKVVTTEEIKGMEDRIVGILNDAYEKSVSYKEGVPDWLGQNWQKINRKKVGIALTALPEGFTVHRNLKKILEKKKQSIEEGDGIDWGTGEALAFGSLLLEGYHVRLSGQDTERGTFSHRHAVIHEQQNVSAQERPQYRPLCHIPGATGEFHVSNSNLSELAVLGFEYGYSTEHPNALVLWEAQFGDFANGAQVVFDQFISSAESKWLRSSGLVCLLPHGYESGGPEHSSARMERFLQSCNDDADELSLNYLEQLQSINWQIVNCTTPANFFHVLRRQVSFISFYFLFKVHRDFRKPLIVFTPKFGLRHPIASSKLSEFCGNSKFQRAIPDDGHGLPQGLAKDDKVRRVLFCSGKIWIHLMDHRIKISAKDPTKLNDVVFVRLEQIAPFPYDLVQQQLKKYPNVCFFISSPKNFFFLFFSPFFFFFKKKSDLNFNNNV
ncbi:hypothetical protein RFI_01949 [Reticulomyxa filosa]|uniref:Transketolase-like pyrimidine-binding domain-containing protein n=1 Tax=Reticulomyxa filosa TaxID=46433 RepID=X6PAD4_RETFI|nr:hypothetical protein RFI_01949 [Reticulomyxa filosa]|eukprot:ETO35126.1 hypothetical protein RFI_01949 [Reticulomyxa filosa]